MLFFYLSIYLSISVVRINLFELWKQIFMVHMDHKNSLKNLFSFSFGETRGGINQFNVLRDEQNFDLQSSRYHIHSMWPNIA